MNSQFPRLPRPPRLTQRIPGSVRSFHSGRKMSGPATSPGLQLAAITLNTSFASAPEDAKEKAHHLKNGRFAPPWPSWEAPAVPKLMKFLLL
jgi:hypothetical protein